MYAANSLLSFIRCRFKYHDIFPPCSKIGARLVKKNEAAREFERQPIPDGRAR